MTYDLAAEMHSALKRGVPFGGETEFSRTLAELTLGLRAYGFVLFVEFIKPLCEGNES